MPTKEGLAKLYDMAAWQRRRALQLKQFPLCAECLRPGAVRPATCVDHVERWRAGRADDINRFLLEPIQSLCENCHNRKTAAERASAKHLEEQAARVSFPSARDRSGESHATGLLVHARA